VSQSLQKFRTLYPEFAGVADATVSEVIEDVSLELAPIVWGVLYLRALLALSAHLLALRAQSAQAGLAGGAGSGLAPTGGVSSLATGGQSVSFGGASLVASRPDSSQSDAILASTPYGQEYLRLRGRIYTGPRVL
jgi:hypothetical protein